VEIEYVFRELDEDHGGTISKQELKKALEKKDSTSPSKAK